MVDVQQRNESSNLRMIKRLCRHCFESVELSESHLGECVPCPHCDNNLDLEVKRAYTSAEWSQEASNYIRWRCDKCNELFDFHGRYRGDSVYCPHCSHFLSIPPTTFQGGIRFAQDTLFILYVIAAGVFVVPLIIYVILKVLQKSLNSLLGGPGE